MNLTEEHYKVIEEMSALFFSPEEIAVNLEVDEEEFSLLIQLREGEVYKAFMKGRLKTDLDLRTSILQSALNGSSPAQQMMKDFQNRSNYE